MKDQTSVLRNRLVVLIVVLVFFALAAYGVWRANVHFELQATQTAYTVTPATVPPAETPASTEAVLEKPVDEMGLGDLESTITNQAAVDAALLEMLDHGGFTLQDPYVQVDPYGASPLTAVALFNTQAACRISVHVAGDTPKADVDFTFATYTTRHSIPILGLYANRANLVTLTAIDRSGASEQVTFAIGTEPLPDFLNGFRLLTFTSDETQISSGLNFPTGCQSEQMYPFAFDCNGAIRWYLPNYDTQFMKVFFIRDTEGGFVLCQGENNQVLLRTVNALGRLQSCLYSSYDLHHDLYQTDHNTWIILGNNPDSDATIEDIVYELSPETGEILHVLDYQAILERTRRIGYYALRDTNQDWLHMNSVEEYQGDLIVSSNHQSLIMRNSWDGKIKWMLGDPTDYLDMYQPYLLTPIGVSFEWPYNQHDVSVLPDQDGNPDTVDLLVFDNGTSRTYMDQGVSEGYSRLVRYRVDEKNMTVEQVWSFGKDRAALFSYRRGGALLLPNGNVLGTFDIDMDPSVDFVKSSHAVYLEVNRLGDVVWQCLGQSKLANNRFTPYRCERLNIYTRNANDLRLGDSVRLFIPDEVWSEFQVQTPAQQTPVATAFPAGTVSPDAPAAKQNSASTNAPIAWQVTAESAELLDTLHTETDVPQYEGGVKTVSYDHAPATGMQFALLNLTVIKVQASKTSFDWTNLRLVLSDGTAYARAEDTYLSDHGYNRINGTKLSLGSTSGYACFEIPSSATLTGAVFQYTQDGAVVAFPLN